MRSLTALAVSQPQCQPQPRLNDLQCDPKRSKYLACALMVRGQEVNIADLTRNVERLQKKLDMIYWNKEGFKIGVLYEAGCRGNRRSRFDIAMLELDKSNTTARQWPRTLHAFSTRFRILSMQSPYQTPCHSRGIAHHDYATAMFTAIATPVPANVTLRTLCCTVLRGCTRCSLRAAWAHTPLRTRPPLPVSYG